MQEIAGVNLLQRARMLLGLMALGTAAFSIGFFFDAITGRSAAIIAVAILGSGVFVMPYRWAIIAMFLYLNVEGLAKMVSRYNPIVHVGVDILVTILCARYLVGRFIRRERLPEKLPPLTPLFVAHFIWFAIQAANPYALNLMASLAAMKMYVIGPVLYFFGYYLVSSKKEAHTFMLVWIVMLVIQVATSLYQFHVGPSSVTSISPLYAVALQKFQGMAFRPFGTTAVAGGCATLIFLVLPFLVYFAVTSKNLFLKITSMVLVPLSYLTLIYAQIRAAYVKASIAILLFLAAAFWKSSARIRVGVIAFAAVCALAFVYVLPNLVTVEKGSDTEKAFERSATLFDSNKVKTARAGALDRILYYAKEVPLGAGLSRTGAASGKFQDLIKDDPFFKHSFFTDNFWALAIVDLGIPGAIILTALLFSFIVRPLRARSRMYDPELLLLQSILISVNISIYIGLWGGEGVVYNPEATFFWFFNGVLMRLPELDTEVEFVDQN